MTPLTMQCTTGSCATGASSTGASSTGNSVTGSCSDSPKPPGYIGTTRQSQGAGTVKFNRADCMPLMRHQAETTGLCAQLQFYNRVLQEEKKAVQENPELTPLEPKIRKEMAALQHELTNKMATGQLLMKGLMKHNEDIANDPSTPPIEPPNTPFAYFEPGLTEEPAAEEPTTEESTQEPASETP
jgi:hypothetical protein